MESLLFPVSNRVRSFQKLDGLWNFKFDPKGVGEKEGWNKGLGGDVIKMPVPASFSDFFTDRESRDYCGDFWYETTIFVPEYLKGKKVCLRFGSVTHRAVVYLNGKEVGGHVGGFLPFNCDISDAAKYGEENILTVKVNNELDETTLPCGNVKTLKDGRKLITPYFDFYNYSGIHRSVYLLGLPETEIEEYDYTVALDGADAKVCVSAYVSGKDEGLEAEVILEDETGKEAGKFLAKQDGKSSFEGTIDIKNAHLWDVLKPYLYTITIKVSKDGEVLDEYKDRIGIRTVRIEGEKILLNEKPVYLKGYGKHEDFDVIGRGFSYPVAKRDFECMKWSGANCFRTSHYPYAEEWYRFADEEGFLIIDEVPAVGMMRSLMNFVDAGRGKYTSFFETETVPELQKNHLQAVHEMFRRDKNHPSVIAWSLFNEPETISEFAHNYFKVIFDEARKLDVQNRPLTGALEKTSSPEKCQVNELCDFICLNRYYGWYISGGPELQDAKELFIEEMDAWKAKKLNKPFVFTEFGSDTLGYEHRLPSVMWAQEYQDEYYNMNFEVFDKYDFIQGELTWNFADFQTSEGIFRVGGNKKGVFTRNRQPKQAAYILKRRWDSK